MYQLCYINIKIFTYLNIYFYQQDVNKMHVNMILVWKKKTYNLFLCKVTLYPYLKYKIIQLL